MSALSRRSPFSPSRYSFRLRPRELEVTSHPDPPSFGADEDIGLPYNVQHITRVQYDGRNGQYIGIPREWAELLRDGEDAAANVEGIHSVQPKLSKTGMRGEPADSKQSDWSQILDILDSLSEEAQSSEDSIIDGQFTAPSSIEKGAGRDDPRTHSRELSSDLKSLSDYDGPDALEGQNSGSADRIVLPSSAPLPQTTTSDITAFMTFRSPSDHQEECPVFPQQEKKKYSGIIRRHLSTRLSITKALSRSQVSHSDIAGSSPTESEPGYQGPSVQTGISEPEGTGVREPSSEQLSLQDTPSRLQATFVPADVTYGRHRLLIATLPEDTEVHRRIWLCCL
ncbi:hypothetical protein CERSUDRAFT_93249 [Gelatoporia subvermispora B]|uniref:CRIB domain-containing protein n=1 Tax=Ceriporiopsis subvermispora (strain B) TaxID=914234 RepID=M2QQ46_CERS8|nr:hypothetical protein CERSUDRAFT_93249 [Gelatoporia subvermispora B]